MKGWLLIILTCQAGLVAAQCPERSSINGRLKTILQVKSNQQRLDSLLALRAVCQRCHYNSDSTYLRLLNSVVSTCFFLADLQVGSKPLLQADSILQEAIQLGNAPYTPAKALQLANSYYYQGVLLKLKEQLPEAVRVFDKAINVGKQSGRTDMWDYSFLEQAIDYYQLGDYERCLTKAKMGSYYYNQRNEMRFQAQCTGLQAMALGKMNHLAEAAQLLTSAINTVRTINKQDIDLGDYFIQLGDLNSQLAQPYQALANFQKAIAIFNAHNDRLSINVYTKIGYLYLRHFRDSITARRNFQFVINKTASDYQRARAQTGLGDIHRSNKQYRSALSAYQMGLHTMPINFSAKRLVDNPSATSIKIAANKEYLLTLIQNKADVWLEWAKTSANKTYLLNALQTYQLADQMIDFMRWEQSGQQSKLFWRQKTHELYERAIETSFRLNNVEQAYRFIEKSRSVLLADKLNELGARRQLPPELAAIEQQIQRRIATLQDQLTTQPIGSRQYQISRHRLFSEQEQLDSLIRQLEQTNSAYYRYKYKNDIPALTQIQNWLKKQQASIVSYFVGDSSVYIVGITPSTVRLHQVSSHAYQQTTGLFMKLLTTNALNSKQQFSRFTALSHTLYQQVFFPLSLPTGRVIVSPDGDFIPFELLSRSDHHIDYLVHQYAFSYVYSIQSLLKKTFAQRASSTFLGIAPVSFSHLVVQSDSGYTRLSLPTLTGSEVALRNISSQFTNPTLLTHGTATRRLFQTEAPLAHIVQLFTHADATGTDLVSSPQEPTIFFADSALRLSDLQTSSPFTTQLLVLMACKTGIGVHQRGEGIFSLARGFASLGVPSVLTTLWSVEDEPTYHLTELFYKQLGKGVPKDIALQQAKREFLEAATSAEQMPSNWAGIILIGSSDPISTQNNLLLFITVGLLLVGCLIGLRFLKKQLN